MSGKQSYLPSADLLLKQYIRLAQQFTDAATPQVTAHLRNPQTTGHYCFLVSCWQSCSLCIIHLLDLIAEAEPPCTASCTVL
jgi:hypothetical protein